MSRQVLVLSHILLFCVSSTVAQTRSPLASELLAEGNASLAAAAREKGDSVRGAILFAQQKLNCAACHGQGSSDLVGPDLTKMETETTAEQIVESILQPSKTIKKGFESHQILTVDGEVLVGRIIQESKQRIVLRDAARPDRTITIAAAQIETIKKQSRSAMPDDLVNAFESRQQFLDVAKYVIDLAAMSRENTGDMRAGASKRGDLEPWLRGMALMDQLGCVNCHQPTESVASSTVNGSFPIRRGPNLQNVASRLNRDFVERFIAKPAHVDPGTPMPDMMGERSEDERNVVAQAITSYLFSLGKTAFGTTSIDAESAQRGNGVFHSVGCVACHSPRDQSGAELISDDSVSLKVVAEKYTFDSLRDFLMDPHSVRPSGRMPNMRLNHFEATDIANYLMQLASSDETAPRESQSPRVADRNRVADGKRHFRELNCLKCHDVGEPSANSRKEKMAPSLATARSDHGCLSNEPGSWPRYSFLEDDLVAIQTAIGRLDQPLVDEDTISITMESFRCFACHERQGVGGVSEARSDYFQTEDVNLGPQGRIPPTLTSVGSKLKAKWMRQVLVSGRSIRPYMKTRMPQYGTANVAHLVDCFGNVDSAPHIEFPEYEDPKEIKKQATELVGNRGLNCIACHTFQQKPAQTMPAVDLTEMGERLQKNWFHRYMRAPQLLSPGTVMPTFWPGGKSIRPEMLGGQRDEQIEAIWLYLQDGRQARTPRGLNIKPIELLAKDEAVMLRRSYPGIGKRGIGVGYPGNVNLAFDAEQLRLGLLWKGGFADPGGVWRGQGHGMVRPLSRDVLRLAKGPDLDDAAKPWIADDGRPPRHHFKGYTLDERQQPAIRYTFGDIEVQDYSVSTSDRKTGATVIKRTVTFETPDARPGITFRVASGTEIERINTGHFRFGKFIRVRFDANYQTSIIDAVLDLPKEGDPLVGKQLLVALDLPKGTTTLTLQYEFE